MSGTENILARSARALVADPRIVAPALAGHQARTGLKEDDLAAWLGLTPERLHALALCTRPDPASPTHAGNVDALARYIGCDTERLRHLLVDDPTG